MTSLELRPSRNGNFRKSESAALRRLSRELLERVRELRKRPAQLCVRSRITMQSTASGRR